MLNDDAGCFGQLIVLALCVLFSFFIGGFCVQYTVEFWASYLKGVEVVVPFLPCGVAGIFVSSIAVPVAIFTWILSFVL